MKLTVAQKRFLVEVATSFRPTGSIAEYAPAVKLLKLGLIRIHGTPDTYNRYKVTRAGSAFLRSSEAR